MKKVTLDQIEEVKSDIARLVEVREDYNHKIKELFEEEQRYYRKIQKLKNEYAHQEINIADEDGFKSIEKIHDWGSYYMLNNKKIENDSKLKIKLDNGSILDARAKIEIYKGKSGACDMYIDQTLYFLAVVNNEATIIKASYLQKAKWDEN